MYKHLLMSSKIKNKTIRKAINKRKKMREKLEKEIRGMRHEKLEK